jgi:hypothetical protein
MNSHVNGKRVIIPINLAEINNKWRISVKKKVHNHPNLVKLCWLFWKNPNPTIHPLSMGRLNAKA